MMSGYFLRCRATGELTHGPFDKQHYAFTAYEWGVNEIVHRRESGEINIVFRGDPLVQAA